MADAPTPMLALDHLVVAASSLAEGLDWCDTLLGFRPESGGRHASMGTHNRVFAIGSARYPRAYFEIIAIDPQAPRPGQARWFDLDDAALQAQLAHGPRLGHWVARCTDIDGEHTETVYSEHNAAPLKIVRYDRSAEFAYDALGNLIKRENSDGSFSRLEYHPTLLGKLVRVENNDGWSAFSYDAAGNLKTPQGAREGKADPTRKRQTVETVCSRSCAAQGGFRLDRGLQAVLGRELRTARRIFEGNPISGK